MSHQSQSLQEGIVRVVYRLYSNPLALDFRRPAVVISPTIREHYESAIKQPLDLGTLLKNCLEGKTCTTDALRKDICLIFDNSISYNNGNNTMLCICQHLLGLANALFEELLHEPLFSNSAAADSQSGREALLVSKRRERFEFIRHFPLTNVELRLCMTNLQNVMKGLAGTGDGVAINGALKQSMALVRDALDIQEEQEFCEALPIDSNPSATLQAILQPIIDACKTDTSTIAINSDLALDVLFTHEGCPNPAHRSALKAIEEEFGELAVLVQERNVRGIDSSCIWGRPCHVVWAQMLKTDRGNWCPALVLGGGAGTDVHPIYTNTNTARLPLEQMKTLSGSKPNPNYNPLPPMTSSILAFPSTSNNEFPATVCPDGYLLIEFLGDQELAWVEADSVLPFFLEAQGEMPDQITEAGGKCYSQDVIKEAMDAALLLSILNSGLHGSEGNHGLLMIPTLEGLTESLTYVAPPKSKRKRLEEEGGDANPGGEALDGLSAIAAAVLAGDSSSHTDADTIAQQDVVEEASDEMDEDEASASFEDGQSTDGRYDSTEYSSDNRYSTGTKENFESGYVPNDYRSVISSMEVIDVPASSSQYSTGVGVLHSRSVDMSTRLLVLEDAKCIERKNVIRHEIASLEADVARMQAAARERAGRALVEITSHADPSIVSCAGKVLSFREQQLKETAEIELFRVKLPI